jgi:uncharacterized protein (DUF983 family)
MRLKKRLVAGNMHEVDPKNYLGYTAYIIDKGRDYGLCMRLPNGKMADLNDTMFVNLHEMAHLCTDYMDNHDDTFNDYFVMLLRAAIDLGLYKYVDYSKTPRPWCSIELSSTPITGAGLSPLTVENGGV